MQQRHEEEQWLLTQLEEAAKLCWAECMAQKARREAEEKYRGGAAVKMGGSNPCKRCVCTGQDFPVHSSR